LAFSARVVLMPPLACAAATFAQIICLVVQ
jgi:hypothetical protein